MTTCLLIGFNVLVADTVSLTAQSILDVVVGNSFTTSLMDKHNNNFYSMQKFAALLATILFIIAAFLCAKAILKVYGSTPIPEMTEHKPEQQQSTTPATKRECF